MKHTFGITLLLLVISLTTWSQSARSGLRAVINKEGNVVIVPNFKNFDFKAPASYYNSYIPFQVSHVDYQLDKFSPLLSTFDLPMEQRPGNIQVQSGAYKPFFDLYSPMRMRMSPMAFDFNELYTKPLNDDFYFIMSGYKETMPGLGGVTTISPSLALKTGSLTLGAGMYGGRYYTPFNPSPDLMMGVNAYAALQVHERITIKAWGQYTSYDNGKNNPFVMMNRDFNNTCVGGAMEFKITDKFGVGAGVNWEFNPMKRKMEPQPIFYPIFYKN